MRGTWEDDMVCQQCQHSIDVHMSECLVPDCECRISMDRIYNLYVVGLSD